MMLAFPCTIGIEKAGPVSISQAVPLGQVAEIKFTPMKPSGHKLECPGPFDQIPIHKQIPFS